MFLRAKKARRSSESALAPSLSEKLCVSAAARAGHHRARPYPRSGRKKSIFKQTKSSAGDSFATSTISFTAKLSFSRMRSKFRRSIDIGAVKNSSAASRESIFCAGEHLGLESDQVDGEQLVRDNLPEIKHTMLACILPRLNAEGARLENRSVRFKATDLFTLNELLAYEAKPTFDLIFDLLKGLMAR